MSDRPGTRGDRENPDPGDLRSAHDRRLRPKGSGAGDRGALGQLPGLEAGGPRPVRLCSTEEMVARISRHPDRKKAARVFENVCAGTGECVGISRSRHVLGIVLVILDPRTAKAAA